VVEVDAGQDGAVGVDDVDGVEPPAQTDFEHHGVQPLRSQQRQNGQRGEFEITQAHRLPCRVGGVAGTLDGSKMRQQRIGLHRLSVNAAALLEMHQMRRGVDADAVAGSQQNRFEHGAGRAFAVGSGHSDHRAGKVQTHRRAHRLHPLQAEVDDAVMQLLGVCQPAVQGVRRRRHAAG